MKTSRFTKQWNVQNKSLKKKFKHAIGKNVKRKSLRSMNMSAKDAGKNIASNIVLRIVMIV